MSQRFAVVHEAEADFRTATELADRVIVDAINDWLDADELVNQRTWVAETGSGQRLTWKGIKQLAREAGIRVHGHFDGSPGLPDAAAARRAILFLRESFSDLKAIVLIRDQDDEPERLGGLNQARNQACSGLPIVIGFAVVEREAWVLCGFDAEEDEEMKRLEDEHTNLGFDPCTRSHDLTACKDDTAKRSPKRVLRALTGGDHDRERRCWTHALLATLRQRGAENGLAAYFRDIRERLAPLIGHVPQK
jgi:hypothetical protein